MADGPERGVHRRARRLAQQLGRRAGEDVERRGAVGQELGLAGDLQRQAADAGVGVDLEAADRVALEIPRDLAVDEGEVGVLVGAGDLDVGGGQRRLRRRARRERVLVGDRDELALPGQDGLGRQEGVDLQAVEAEVAVGGVGDGADAVLVDGDGVKAAGAGLRGALGDEDGLLDLDRRVLDAGALADLQVVRVGRRRGPRRR